MVNIHEAKSKLSQFVREVLAGEEIVIARAGKPVAKLVPYQPFLDFLNRENLEVTNKK